MKINSRKIHFSYSPGKAHGAAEPNTYSEEEEEGYEAVEKLEDRETKGEI